MPNLEPADLAALESLRADVSGILRLHTPEQRVELARVQYKVVRRLAEWEAIHRALEHLCEVK